MELWWSVFLILYELRFELIHFHFHFHLKFSFSSIAGHISLSGMEHHGFHLHAMLKAKKDQAGESLAGNQFAFARIKRAGMQSEQLRMC